MAQETVIHRIDAELALGSTVAPVPADLAVDGIDEVLVVFLAYASALWCEDFGDDLAEADERPVLVSTGGVRLVGPRRRRRGERRGRGRSRPGAGRRHDPGRAGGDVALAVGPRRRAAVARRRATQGLVGRLASTAGHRQPSSTTLPQRER